MAIHLPFGTVTFDKGLYLKFRPRLIFKECTLVLLLYKTYLRISTQSSPADLQNGLWIFAIPGVELTAFVVAAFATVADEVRGDGEP